jgi:hypothetical protein
MFNLPTLALCLLPAAGGPDSIEVLPKGVWGMSAIIVAIGKDGVEVNEVSPGAGPTGKRFLLNLTGKTKIEIADLSEKKGESKLNTKAMDRIDLRPDQHISVIVSSDGRSLTLLRVVVSGPGLVSNVPEHIKKLGGKMERLNWFKDRIAYKVDLKGTKTTDADLLLISKMPNISSLNLSFTRVTDKGIAVLGGYKHLHALELNGVKVTDEAIATLVKIPNLDTVQLAQTEVTDKGIAVLVDSKIDITVCKAGLGDKAHFRALQQYRDGKLQFNYLMIGDTHYGSYLAGKLAWPPGEKPQDRRREATTYYHRHGPVGQVMSKFDWFKPAEVLHQDPSDVRLPASLVACLGQPGLVPAGALSALWSEPAIGVIRLNVGTQAAYGRPLQQIHFYNSTKELEALTWPNKGQPVYFGFIQDAKKRGCSVQLFHGDERTNLGKKGPKKFYHALFIDITRNDLRDINTSLFTKEAVAEMMASLTETGLACYHTSHRYHDMVPPLVDAAKSLNLAWKVAKDNGAHGQIPAHFSSEWVVIARKAEYLQHLQNVLEGEHKLQWMEPESTGKHLWRDGQTPDLKSLARPPVK